MTAEPPPWVVGQISRIMLTWGLLAAAMVLPGDAAAVGIATVNMCAILGGFVGPYWMGWMREATGSYAVGIGTLFVPCMLAAGCILWLLPQWNRREAF